MTTTPQAHIGLLPSDDVMIARRDGRIELPLVDPDPGARFDTSTVTWSVQLHRLGQNEHSHWSLTGAVYEGNLCVESRLIVAGQVPELAVMFPELALFADLHLSNIDGVPMHALHNGLWWLGFTRRHSDGVWVDRPDREPEDRERVASHFRITVDEADQLERSVAASGHPVATLEAWIDSQRRRWALESKLARAILELAPLPGSPTPRPEDWTL